MYDLTVLQNYSVAGKSYSQQQTISQPRLESVEELIPIAWAGTLTTRTSGTAGTFTMADSGHLVTTASHIDIYWIDTNGVQQMCRAALVGTVSGTSVPFTGATGTALPPASTVCQVAVVKTFSFTVTGDNVSALVASCDFAAATIVLLDVTPSENLVMGILPGGCFGYLGSGTNPLAGDDPITVHMSHNDLVSPRNVRVAALLSA